MNGNDNHIKEVQISKAYRMHGNDEKISLSLTHTLCGYLKIPIKYVIWLLVLFAITKPTLP